MCWDASCVIGNEWGTAGRLRGNYSRACFGALQKFFAMFLFVFCNHMHIVTNIQYGTMAIYPINAITSKARSVRQFPRAKKKHHHRQHIHYFIITIICDGGASSSSSSYQPRKLQTTAPPSSPPLWQRRAARRSTPPPAPLRSAAWTLDPPPLGDHPPQEQGRSHSHADACILLGLRSKLMFSTQRFQGFFFLGNY